MKKCIEAVHAAFINRAIHINTKVELTFCGHSNNHKEEALSCTTTALQNLRDLKIEEYMISLQNPGP